MSVLFQLPKMVALNIFLERLPGAKLYFYAAGTSAPQPTYTTAAMLVGHTNPVIADANGRFPPIFLDPDLPDYKVNLTDSADTAQPGYPMDNYPVDGEINLDIISGLLYPRTISEQDAGVTPADLQYPVLDLRRYGAVGDWDGTIGLDNLSAFEDAADVAKEMGGGVIQIKGGGDFWISDNAIIRSDNTYIYIEPATTLRTSSPTSGGGTLIFAPDPPGNYGNPIRNVGVYGGGTIRNASISVAITGITKANPAVVTAPGHNFANYTAFQLTRVRILDVLGMVEINNDSAGTSGDPEYGITLIDTDSFSINGVNSTAFATYVSGGTASLANENAVAFVACHGFCCIGMDLPESNRKAIAMQINIHGGWIRRNRIGISRHTAIEVKAAIDAPTDIYNAKDIYIESNTIESAGWNGIESIRPVAGGVNDSNIQFLNNTIRSAVRGGTIMDEIDSPVSRGNIVFSSGSTGCNFTGCKDIRGDIHTENAGLWGVNLDSNDNWTFDSVVVRNPADEGIRERDDVSGGKIGRLVIKGSTHTIGYNTISRDHNKQVTIASWDVDPGAGVAFGGELPTLLGQVPGTRMQGFVLDVNNNGGTLQHRIVGDRNLAQASNFADRINGATNAFTNSPTGANASTAMAGGGKISSADTNEFILNITNVVASGNEVGSVSLVFNDSGTVLNADIVRRSVDVNGTTLSRWHVRLLDASSGAAVAFSALPSGDSVSVRVVLFAP